ncbi:Detected protein of unknown function [Hibiscus syriacus]|uniref:Reverse transcriptase domain-containing protein n=1 Tax=Hibiscus syriacus TaxID=106335 RepID=A0A6A2YR81_HIBSY|nr:Detected protein of unknown function [Hibiscus syriacus]
MAEAIAFDIAAGHITKLSSLALSRIGLCWNFKDDLDDLKSIVSAIKVVLLDAEERSHLMNGNELTKEVRAFFSSSNQFAYGLKMGRKIKAIKARFASIQNQSELVGLNNLRGELRIINLGSVKNAKEESRAANLKEKQHLHSLVLHLGATTDDEEKSLEDLQPHPNLKELKFEKHEASVAIMGRRKQVLQVAVSSLQSLGINVVGFEGMFINDNTVDGSTDHHTTINDCPTSSIGFEEVKMALRKIGKDKAVGPDQIPITTTKMPDEWRQSTVIPIYKNKGDPQRCGNYRGIKLLSHTMKIWERVIEARLRQITRGKNRDLHMAFIELEKAYDSVPRDTIWKTLETRRIPTAYIWVIRDMYCRTTSYVRTTVGDTAPFPVEIGLHQGSALSPYIFALIMDDIYCATPDGVPWCMLFADDIVLVVETRTELNSRLATWKTALEEKGLVINIEKTEYLCSNFSGNQNDEDVEAGWLKWRAATGVLCDKKVPLKLKGKFYRMAIRPALLYGSECWAIKKDHVRRMEAAEMRMLRWAYGRTLWDMTPNSAIRMSLGVVSIPEKLREGRLRWFGNVFRRKPSDAVRRVESITVDGARRRRRPRRKWEDCLRFDLKDLALTEDMTSDRKV